MSKWVHMFVDSLPWPRVSPRSASVVSLRSACWTLPPGLTSATPEGHWAGFAAGTSLPWGPLPPGMGSGAWVCLKVDNHKLLLVQSAVSLAIKLNKTLTGYIWGNIIDWWVMMFESCSSLALLLLAHPPSLQFNGFVWPLPWIQGQFTFCQALP